jgi:ABC-type nitrate/sulfonate/bicarbonate transport system ATPase subunit
VTAPLVPGPAGDGAVLLEASDLWLKLGESQILQGVSLKVRDRVRPGVVTGQVVALLGPSGVGKTRLIRLIAGLDAADRGRVAGPEGRALRAGSVGVVFQNYPLLRHRTVVSNLEMAGEANGMPAPQARSRARALLDRFGLGPRVGFYPAQISGGQRQRAAIAQQLMLQKQLLLMDEPFSGLDPVALEDVIKLLLEVAHMDELNTVMVVTHDIRSAMVVSDTIFMLGRDRAPDGKVAGGARIQHCYDLVAEGLAWRPGVEQDPHFVELEREVKERFRVL